MAVIRMSGDLIFEYDIVNDKMYYAGPGEGILYSRQITEGYTDQLLKEAGNRTETVEQQLAEALRSGKPDIYIELCKTDAEGKPRWVKVIGQTFYDEKGEPERVLGKVCDIDDQKKKEWELREKSQKDSLTGLLNKQMELPSFMEPIESWMRSQEETTEQLTLKLLAGGGIITLFFNLIVIAVAAGITEEFLFRGALQRIIGKWTYNHHIIIWSAAIIFSTFHMQFFGFLPRMLLGAYFGYLLYWTRNIWIPVFAHFVNNAIAVISMSDAKLKDNEFITGDISTQNLLPYTIVAIVALFFFVRCCRKLKIIRSSNLNS